MNTIRNFCLAMAVILLASINLTAAELSADEVIAKANQAAYYAGKDGRTAVQMTISDAQGGTRQRAFTILRMNSDDDNQKFYVYFTAPADVRKMAYLVWKNVGGADDRWLWLPALNLKKAHRTWRQAHQLRRFGLSLRRRLRSKPGGRQP